MEDFSKYHHVYAPDQENSISTEFQRLQGQYYLEHAGATLYSEKQLSDTLSHLSSSLNANPHARNLSSKLTEDAIDIIRFQILAHFNTNPEEYSIIFTSGATAALKLIGESFCYETHGCFAYLQDNHTSVLGMREFAPRISCIGLDRIFAALKTSTHRLHDGGIVINAPGNSLFVFPAQSNFSGTKYPLAWIGQVQNGALNEITYARNWFVALDAASFAATNRLNLAVYKPDFVTVSFYKMFGYPTGLGALLVRNCSSHVLRKRYYGGGTVLMALAQEKVAILKNTIHERFEDGTLPFLSILALKHGFTTLKRLNLSFDLISKHTFSLAQYVYRNLLCYHHSNGQPVAVLYHNTIFDKCQDQGPIVNFNLLRDTGEFVGYSEVLHFANLYNIHLRTGCFCNPGACQYFLKLSSADVKRHFDAGHVCGDQHDLVDGYPTGSVRISFGYMSRKQDADKLLEMIENCFITKPVVKKIPKNYRIWENTYKNTFNVSHQSQEDSPKNHNVESVLTPSQNSSKGVLEQIFLYPIKSCGACSVSTKWQLTPTGLKYDRQWMIVNASGVCVTQKHMKKLCLIVPTIDIKEKKLILNYPDQKRISIDIDIVKKMQKSGSLCQSKVCGDQIQGWDCGSEVAEWLVNVLECPGLRLLKQCSEAEDIIGRTSQKNDNFHLSLANKAQYLLINSSSVEWLRGKISEGDVDETLASTIKRFRPNFVVKFFDPFQENDYREFIFDTMRFETGGKCTRCQMICIDQETGKTSKEPLQTLAKEFQGKISFGIYLNRQESDREEYLHVGCRVIGN